jgi:hypothetical protein
VEIIYTMEEVWCMLKGTRPLEVANGTSCPMSDGCCELIDASPPLRGKCCALSGLPFILSMNTAKGI